MTRFQRVAQVLVAVGIVVLVVLTLFLRSDFDTATQGDVARGQQVSQENQQILDRVEGGVDAIEGGYRCLVVLLLIPPEQRQGIPPGRIEDVCGLDPVLVQLLVEGLTAP